MPHAPDNPPSVALVSLGCPKNLVDSEKMLAILAEGGCLVGAPVDQADVIVVNTCGFLSAARDESLTVIEEALAAKAGGSARRVVVAGCLVNRDAHSLYDTCPGVDAIVGVNDRDAILAAVTGDQTDTRLDTPPGPVASDAGRFRLTAPHTAYLRISEGCSRRCTFCTIPAIRGPLRSKDREAVLTEARELIADGALELNVIGQDTTGYGRDVGGATTLAQLLHGLDALDGAEWIRLMYAYPHGFDDALIDAMTACEHVVPYVDIPLQHIADRVLKAMARGVGRKQTETLLATLRDRVEGIAIRTTLIVGFPGETDSDFEQLLDFVQQARFEALGVFEFSAEAGTPAAGMPDQVPDDVKAARAETIMLAQQEIAFRANSDAAGLEVELLIDGTDADGRCVGRRAAQAPDIDSLCYLTDPCEAGTFVSGRVIDWDDYDLIVRPSP